ncbi:MAG: hypothetical protein IJL66_08110 [Lachnospiraceae bacterium]|nr:hypothetical protein [Lachnospiraceae bacterium]
MRVSPEAADGQFAIPVIDTERFPWGEALLSELAARGICAVRSGEEKSSAFDERPVNLRDMFPNDDCAPVYGDWMLRGVGTPEEAEQAILEELALVHGFSLGEVLQEDGADRQKRTFRSRNPRRSMILLSLAGAVFDWDRVVYGDYGLERILLMDSEGRGFAVLERDGEYLRQTDD